MQQKEYLFYSDEDKNYRATIEIYSAIVSFLPPVNSMIDFGCGMAAFARVFQDNGTKDIAIVDHPSLDISKCLIKKDFRFVPCDLDSELPQSLKADLLVCTEVLEHISSGRAIKVLDFITSCADIIIFSAAVPYQDGLGHINTQRHRYWINEFAKRGFDYSDLFKADIIKNEKIFYWLRQNLFIFFKNQPQESPLQKATWLPSNFEIVNVNILDHRYGIKEWIKLLPNVIYNSVSFRYKQPK